MSWKTLMNVGMFVENNTKRLLGELIPRNYSMSDTHESTAASLRSMYIHKNMTSNDTYEPFFSYYEICRKYSYLWH